MLIVSVSSQVLVYWYFSRNHRRLLEIFHTSWNTFGNIIVLQFCNDVFISEGGSHSFAHFDFHICMSYSSVNGDGKSPITYSKSLVDDWEIMAGITWSTVDSLIFRSPNLEFISVNIWSSRGIAIVFFCNSPLLIHMAHSMWLSACHMLLV